MVYSIDDGKTKFYDLLQLVRVLISTASADKHHFLSSYLTKMCTVSQSYFEYPTKLKCRLSLTSKTDQEICNLISFQVEYYQLNHGCLPVRLLHYLTCSPSPAGTTGTVMMVVLVMLVMVVVLCYYTLHPNISVWLQEKRRRRQKFARLPPRAPPHPHPLHPGNPHLLHPGKFVFLSSFSSSSQPFPLFAPPHILSVIYHVMWYVK